VKVRPISSNTPVRFAAAATVSTGCSAFLQPTPQMAASNAIFNLCFMDKLNRSYPNIHAFETYFLFQ
jgi:hypothetical protein